MSSQAQNLSRLFLKLFTLGALATFSGRHFQSPATLGVKEYLISYLWLFVWKFFGPYIWNWHAFPAAPWNLHELRPTSLRELGGKITKFFTTPINCGNCDIFIHDVFLKITHEKINGHRELTVSSRWPRWSRLRSPMITAQSWLG